MKCRRAAIVLLIQATPILLLAAQPAIEGTVVEQATLSGVPGVKVRFFSQDSGAHETLTDGAGRFSLLGLTAGPYYVSAEKDGYYSPAETDEDGARRKQIRLSGSGTERVNFELLRYGSLRGRVVNAEGQPMAGVPVALRPSQPGQNPVVSGEDGSFLFTNLRSRAYAVLARAQPAPSSGAGGLADVTTYFPGVLDVSLAEAVTIPPGTDVTGIEIRVQRVPVYKVSGVVLDEAGKPASGVPVRLRQNGGAMSRFENGRIGRFTTAAEQITFYSANVAGAVEDSGNPELSAEDGRFSFVVPQGDWIVQAETPWERIGKDDRQLIGDRAVTVSRGDQEGIEIRIASTFDFIVPVEIEGERESGNFVPPLILQPLEAGRPPVFGQPMDTGPETRGAIKFGPARAGSYTVLTGGLAGTDGLYLAGFSVGGQDALKQPFYLSPGAAPAQAVFRKTRGGIQGTIDGGKPAKILVFPAAQSANDVIACVEMKDDKPFTLPGLAPGDYYVTAVDRIDPGKFADKSFVAGLVTIAKRVSVEEGLVSVNLGVNPWPER